MSVVTNELGEKIEEGYLGNLTPEHENALQQFWVKLFEIFDTNVEQSDVVDRKGGLKAVAKGMEVSTADPKEAKKAKAAGGESDVVSECLAKYGGRYIRQGFIESIRMDPPDMSALRYLRARKFDVKAAVSMCVGAVQFRLDANVSDIVATGELGNKDVPGFLNQFRRGISYVEGSTADEDMPIYFIHVGRHFTNAQKPEVLQRFVVMAMENVRMLCTPPMEKSIIVFDMSGFGLKNMDWGCVMFILKCLESYYPESLRRIYIHGAPWIFKGVWAALQPLLDPVVAAKIKFSNKAHELEEYVSRTRFSKDMGGTLNWEWKYQEPEEHENDLMKDTATRDAIIKEQYELFDKFIAATKTWAQSPSKETAHRRLVLMKQLRLKYYQLDPYIRARTVYHRNKIIRNDFSVRWEYPQLSGPDLSQDINTRHNVPALIKWLRDHGEDTLEDCVGANSPSFTHGTAYTTHDAPKAKPKKASKPKSEASEGKGGAAAAGAAGAGAVAAGAAGAAVATKKSSREPKESAAEMEEHHRRRRSHHGKRSHRKSSHDHHHEEEDLAASKGSVAEKPRSRKPVPKVVNTEEPEEVTQQQSSGGISGAGAAVAAGATGAVAAGAAALGLSRKASDDSFVSATGDDHHHGAAAAAAQPVSRAAAPQTVTYAAAPQTATREAPIDNELEEDDDDDIELEEELALEDDAADDDVPVHTKYDHTHDRELAEEYDLDDEERSILSDDEPITPETVLMPQYLSGKPTADSVALSESSLYKDIEVCHDSIALFFNSQMREAEELCSRDASNRLYSSFGMALLNFVKSLMTFEPSDMQIAMKSCTHTVAIAKLLRKKPGKINKLMPIGKKKATLQSMTVVERHAEVVYAQSLLFRALLGVIYSGDFIGVVRQAINLRTSFTILRNMMQMIEKADSSKHLSDVTGGSRNDVVDEHLRSGVYFGNGISMMILSLFPARLLRFIEGMGFSADRRRALDLLQRVGGWSKSQAKPAVTAEKEGISRTLCDSTLLAYHLVLAARIPVADQDLAFADKILSWNLQRYSKGTFFLYFSARLYAAQALPEKAIEYYRHSIESQREYKQLHHLCFWNLSLTYLSTCDFARAYECYDVLSRESNWSKSIYQYAKAVMLYETNSADREQSSAIMQTVTKLDRKVAGQHLSFEKFVRCKAQKFVAQNNHLPLPALEFSYMWQCFTLTPVFLLVENSLTRIDEFIDQLEATGPTTYGSSPSEYYSAYCLAFLLRGVALRYVAYPEPHTFVRHPANDSINPSEAAEDAVRSFEKVFELGSHLDAIDRYIVYFAHLELGRVRAAMGNDSAAIREYDLILSRKPLVQQDSSIVRKQLRGDKANYLLSDLCQMQAHASRLMVGAQGTRAKVASATRTRSVRASSTSAPRTVSQPQGLTGVTRAETLGQAPRTVSSSQRSSRGDLGSRARESRLYA
ncbi:hypothetical protein MCUN1_002636 [Malassezia cuniculi]|uniref:CRAL-TRIO domain-containing protein n=1 Tax=Malassezia cuniculi TaxID=948313 RepID=A0AAF0J7L0_9BASI|nr:hypothetical protein MCUN1_002636 [Malassezia cuniculi]